MGAERGAGGRDQHRVVAGRPNDPQNGSAQDEARLRAQLGRSQIDAQRAGLPGPGHRSAGQVGHHRRSPATSVGRQTSRSRNHSRSR